MGRLFVILLELCMIVVTYVDGTPTLSSSGVPQLCLNEGILAYEDAPPSGFSVNLRDSIEQLQGLIDSGCSNTFGRFLCTAHLPRLDLVRYGLHDKEVYLRPCSEVCRAVWRDCRLTARQLRIERTPEFDCSKNFQSEKKGACLSYLHPPMDQPMIVNGTRLNATSVSILYTPPKEGSRTEAFRVTYNDTASWGEAFFTTPRSRSYHTLNITDLMSAEAFKFEVAALNNFGNGPGTVLRVPAFQGIPDIGRTCEDITVPMCKSGLDYQQTAMPNSLGHLTQDDAGLEIHQFYPLVKVNCSTYLQTFLCAMYLPRCSSGSGGTQLPCRDLCVLARNGCKELMNKFGFSWPQSMTCENFPSYDEGNDCYLGGIPDTGTGCEEITVPMCKSDLDYQQTAMPNSLGHLTQDEAVLEIHQFWPLVEINCSDYLKTFLCAIYTPRCTSGSSRTLMPCRDLCVQVRDGCEQLMITYGFSWPESLWCESFPSYDEENDCYLGGAPVLDVGTNDRCEDISVSWCRSALGYNQTAMPNSLGHQFVIDAEMQLVTFTPVVQNGCSPHFSSFICSLYLPSCYSAPVLPCRELCEEARNGCAEVLLEFGFQWPEQLACEDLPSHNDGATCYLGDFVPPQSNQTTGTMTNVKPRRYDTHNLGVPSLFRGWVDVQGQGAANDYCRLVTSNTGGYLLSCSLAGMEGAPTDLNYNSTGPWFDAGHMDTWYMMDVNEDGRDDYCRCIGCLPTTYVSCLLAGEGAFMAQTFDYDPVPGGCHYNTVNPYFGR
ncbi:uncharacterized protein LOC119745889 isoform X2 [Patiria miniata]|uniref:Uncharacterized protein n=1 Tax=Patiria miniata TaxID=46514 RepID=A0A914BS85_PATMI|nr:uncharacterized protein LOC119745889 isoform X2 [Patiria miniata]